MVIVLVRAVVVVIVVIVVNIIVKSPPLHSARNAFCHKVGCCVNKQGVMIVVISLSLLSQTQGQRTPKRSFLATLPLQHPSYAQCWLIFACFSLLE